MKLARPARSKKQESTIALINIVFLMLIFFLIAGALAPPLDHEITMIDAESDQSIPPPDALSIRADGTLFYRGKTMKIDALAMSAEDEQPLRLIADQELPAEQLIETLAKLQSLSDQPIKVVTQRSAAQQR